MAYRFFADETDLALGRKLAETRGDVLYPGHPDLPEVPRQTPDDRWLAVVGTRNLVVFTHDQAIRYEPVETQAWIDNLVRGFVLTGRASQTPDDSLSVIQRYWPSIERLVADRSDGPWMYALTNDGVREISLT